MLDTRSKHLRRLVVRGLRAKNGGHVGPAMSLIEILRVLYDDIKRPDDKIILSKGHGALALWAVLSDKGYFPVDELDNFCKKDGILGGHPSPSVPGVMCHTGSLGHGLSIACGLAVAAKMKKERHRIFVIVGDGEIQEGSVWEAAMCAAKHSLDNLMVIVDRNMIQSAGLITEICPISPLDKKWEAFGWECVSVPGHSINSLRSAFSGKYFTSGGTPKCIIANTVKGRGILFAENNPLWHHKSGITEDQFKKIEEAIEAA